MKRKVLSILLIGVFVLGITGCGSDNKKASDKSNDSKKIELYPVDDTKNYKAGYINNTGKWAIEPTYRITSSFDLETGLAKVQTRGKGCSIGYINTKGELVLEDKYCGGNSFHNGYAHVIINDSVLNGDAIIDTKGNYIIEPYKYEKISDVSKNGLVVVKESSSSNNKLIRLDGTLIKELDSGICEGLNDKGYGDCKDYIYDENGNIIKQEKGTIYSLNNNNYGFIENGDFRKAIYTIKDNKIEYLSDYIYYSVSDFSISNLAMVKFSSNEPYRLINIKGERINDANYKTYRLLLDGKWVVTLEDDSNQVLNADGSILVDTFVAE